MKNMVSNPLTTTITAKFEEAAAKHADRAAVRSGGGILSYGKLNKQANRVARTLVNLKNFDKNRPAAILLGRGSKTIAAILGVLKSGSFFVVLSPDYPRQRLDFFVSDSAAAVILTDNKNLKLAQKLVRRGMAVVNLDRINEKIEEGNLGLMINPDDPAFVVYTSGTTGRPKGVLHVHRNIPVFVFNNLSRVRYRADDILAFFYSFGHIGGLVNIFFALLNGASLYIFDLKEQSGAELARILRSEKITIFPATPSLFRVVANSLKKREKLPFVRAVILAGETVWQRDFLLFKKHFSSRCFFINRLGHTAFSTFLEFCATAKTRFTGDLVPVGRPFIRGVKVLVDSKNKTGELIVQSRDVFSRYFNQPSEVDSQLLPPAHSRGTILRTGDLGRTLKGGIIECLGRADDSRIKINGNQVALNEIEKALASHRLIADAHSAVFKEKNDQDFLVLFYIAERELDLRGFLMEKFPPYMVPRSFVRVAHLPLNGNGKIDVEVLKNVYRQYIRKNQFEILANETERQLARIYKRVLGLKKIGRQDDFFERGGDSLKVADLTTRIARVFGAKLSHADVYKNPGLSHLAAVIERKAKRSPGIYPDYFNCFYAAIPQKIKKQFHKKICLSLLPALNFACLPSYVLVNEFLRRDTEENARLLGQPDFLAGIGLRCRMRSLRNRRVAVSYYNKNQTDSFLISGTPYYLPHIPFFYKSENYIKAAREKRLLAFRNISLFWGKLEKGPMIFNGNFNYHGRIGRDDFLNFWEGNRVVPGMDKKFLPGGQEPAFRVLEILNRYYQPPGKEILADVLKENAREYFLARTVEDNDSAKVIFGREALSVFGRELKTLPDIVIVDVLHRFGRSQFFLRDALVDLCTFDKRFLPVLEKNKAALGHWNDLCTLALAEIERKDIQYRHRISILPEITEKNRRFLSTRIKRVIGQKIAEIKKLEETTWRLLLQR